MRGRMNCAASNRAVLCEALEGRRLLSASSGGVAELQAGTLHVEGTRASDLILVSVDYSDPAATKVNVNLNGNAIGSFLLSDVARVEVYGGRGDDSIRFDESTDLVPLPLIAHGEAGNDTLVGGFLNDELYGDAGSDALFGNDGNDQMYGGVGDDLLAGGFNDDFLDGEGGDDTLYGEAGFDTLRGGAGRGRDMLDGGDDNDDIDGGAGIDQLFGGSGSDTFAGTEKAEEILDLAPEDVYVPVVTRR